MDRSYDPTFSNLTDGAVSDNVVDRSYGPTTFQSDRSNLTDGAVSDKRSATNHKPNVGPPLGGTFGNPPLVGLFNFASINADSNRIFS